MAARRGSGHSRHHSFSGKRHGNLSLPASRVYEAIRSENRSYSKTKAAKIANAEVHGTINRHGRKGA